MLSTISNDIQLTIKPSQRINIIWIILGVVLYKLLLIPTIIAIFKVLSTHLHSYELCERSLIERKGILDRYRWEVPYYRITSVQWNQPWYLLILGLSNVTLKTSDPLAPVIKLKAISKGEDYACVIRDQVEYWREKKNVREINIDNY